jgi:hypothetical protein
MTSRRLLAMSTWFVLSTALVGLAVYGPGPNSTVIPSTQQNLSIIISAPPDGSTVDIPPGTAQVEGNCAIGTVPGQPLCVLYVLDVSGSTDRDFMTANGIAYVDANGNGMGTFGSPDAGDNFNVTSGDIEAGEVLDGEIAGVVALHASIGNPSNVRVGLEAFASAGAPVDVGPGLGFQYYITPPQLDANVLLGSDIDEAVRTFRSEFSAPSGGSVVKFTAVSQATLGSSTNFKSALSVMNSSLLNCTAPKQNIVFFLSDGESNSGFRCDPMLAGGGNCGPELTAAIAAGTKIHTVAVGASADPIDLQYIASQTGGTFTQVTNPSLLAAVLPTISPAGLDTAIVDGDDVGIDALGNFTKQVTCPGTGPFTVTATCIAADEDHTEVHADITLNCQPLCGNGMLDANEECEPPNTATCDATCQRVPDCGDGFTDAPEACDPPDGVSCNASCQLIACGDNVVEGQEECEPPNTATCDATCQRVPDCGDGFVDAPEQCEPPSAGTCDADCTLIVCGNGEIEAGEECEPENPVPPCDGFCQRIPVCGDSLLDGTEVCDPPDGTTCDTDCTPIACGNNDVEPGEECEPPSTATCDATCQRVPSCGDTFIDGSEECEPPNSPNCDGSCQLIACGNGIVQTGEECEPPNSPNCDASCQRVPVCGDTFVDAPETCEPPATGTCDSDCTLIACGNGEVETGEECEPPNTVVCGPTCQRISECGDGFIDELEECEPPSSPNCDAACQLIACGNGMVQPGEECEPPNTATCDPTCQRVPTCNDGFIDSPPEECEPPNTTTCDANCQLAEVCTNGLDDDGDTLIDCADPDCPPCPEPRKDPGKIKFDTSGAHRDKLWGHGRFTPDGTFDPATQGVHIVLTNRNGIIYRATVPANALVRYGRGFLLKEPTGTRYDGLRKLFLRDKGASWTFTLDAVGDLSAATEAEMTFSFGMGNQSLSITRRWVPRGYGWLLRND